MGRNPKVEISPDGFAKFKASVPLLVWRALEIYASSRDASPTLTMREFFSEIADAYLRDPNAFGRLFPGFARALEAAQRAHLGAINIAALERGKYGKFKGVIKQGKRFFAYGRIAASGAEALLELSGFSTDIEAAEFRRRHYMDNGFPYGALADYVDEGKRDLEQLMEVESPTDEQVINSLRGDAKFLPGLAKEIRKYDEQQIALGRPKQITAEIVDSLPPGEALGEALGFPDGLPDEEP